MNDPSVSRPRLTMSLLEEHYYTLPRRRPVVCRLWRMRPSSPPVSKSVTYAVGVESASERYLYCIGEDEARARALIRRIVENELEPIHLGNVVEDYLWEAEHGPVTDTPQSEAPSAAQTVR